MTYEEAIIKLENLIEKMDDPEFIELYNVYCRHSGNNGKQIYKMDELDEVLYDYSPTDIINIIDCNFDTYDEFFRFNERGLLISFSDLDDFIDIYDIAAFILDDEDDLCNKKIEDILSEVEY